MDRPVVIVASDPALLSSLHFALSVEGFDVREEEDLEVPNACLVIDEDRAGGGLAFVVSLRSSGNFAPVILLVTHPDRGLRTRAKRLGVKLLEKPLRHDDLSQRLVALSDQRTFAGSPVKKCVGARKIPQSIRSRFSAI